MDPGKNASAAKETFSALIITNAVLGLLALSLAGACIYFEFLSASDLDPQQLKPYVAEAKQRLEQHSDEIATEAESLASEVLPTIADAAKERARKDYPKYLRALRHQGDEYLDDVEDILIAQVKAKYHDFLQAQRDVLQEEFPEHASREHVARVLDDFDSTIQRLARRYYIQEFRQETDRTIALWNAIEPVSQPGEDQPSLEEQLADYAGDWFVLNFSKDAPMDRALPIDSQRTQSGEP